MRCSGSPSAALSAFHPLPRVLRATLALPVTVRNVSGNLFMKSTSVGLSQLSAECESVCEEKYRPLRTCISYNSQKSARCRSARVCSLCPPPKSLVIQSAEAVSNFQSNICIWCNKQLCPPRQQPSVSGFSGRIVHTSTNPILVSVELSLPLLLQLLLEDSGTVGAPCTSFALPVRLMRLSCRPPVPNFRLQAAHLQATANRCQYHHLPGRHPTPTLSMLVAQVAASLRSRGDVSCAETSLHMGSSAKKAKRSLARSSRMCPSVVVNKIDTIREWHFSE